MGKKPPFASDIEAARYPPPPPPTFHMPQPRQWIPWLVPLIFLANVAMFVYTMYLNDCPSYLSEEVCLFHEFLGRFSFQPFRENPLLGPSIRTWVIFSLSISLFLSLSFMKSVTFIIILYYIKDDSNVKHSTYNTCMHGKEGNEERKKKQNACQEVSPPFFWSLVFLGFF